MPENLFEDSNEYAAMLDRGLRVSGESRDYFMEGRVRSLHALLDAPPRRILDFGCGTGETCAYLASVFAQAEITGTDAAAGPLALARRVHAGPRIRFESLDRFAAQGEYDLCYSNGVFHHIAPGEREAAARLVYRALAPGGRFALAENNPWNPGTRLVMRRIPFDRDAIPFSARQARALLCRAGFERFASTRYLFFFPRALAPLRVLEPWLARVPFGAQYLLLATRPQTT
ncbi:MAG TPA: class I SAM-dependent methyltransferase [Myxococcota bacterium]|nr:class I SAM-dependent methyltransferase [Myxococcota bacterium]